MSGFVIVICISFNVDVITFELMDWKLCFYG